MELGRVKLGLLSDTHLGHRRFAAVASNGRNQREQDVSDAFAVAIDQIIAKRPDLVLLGGDIFDRPTPGNPAIQDGLAGIRKLREAGIDVVGVLGNHDESIENGKGSPALILTEVGATIVRGAEHVSIPSLDCHVLCVSEKDIGKVKLEPGPESGIHLLLAHGAFNARLYKVQESDALPPESISERFVFAGLGDFHRCVQIGRNAWYSGATEHTASDSWRDAQEPKGWLWVDIDAGIVEHQNVPTRRFIDLPPISAYEMAASDLTDRIVAQLADVDVAGAVIRQVVTDCMRGTRNAIDPRAVRKASQGTLNFRLDVRAPEEISVGQDLLSVIRDPYPDWLDEFNIDEPTDQFDRVTDGQLDAWLADPKELARECADNPDPYGLEEPKSQAMGRAA